MPAATAQGPMTQRMPSRGRPFIQTLAWHSVPLIGQNRQF
jgi:hypothetical protein